MDFRERVRAVKGEIESNPRAASYVVAKKVLETVVNEALEAERLRKELNQKKNLQAAHVKELKKEIRRLKGHVNFYKRSPREQDPTGGAVTEIMAEMNTAILKERIRQNQLWGEQEHPLPVWYVILGEEYGEVGQAIQKSFGWGKTTDAGDLESELIHLAAVAQKMAEQVREAARLETKKTERRNGTSPTDFG